MIRFLDTIAGVSLLMVGIFGWRRFRTSALFALGAAGAWFVVPILPFLALLHRPLLLHSILALPRGGVRGLLPRALLAVAWIGVVLPSAAQPWVSGATATLCVAVSSGIRSSGGMGGGPELVAARRALLVLSTGLALSALERLVWPVYVQTGLPLATYLCTTALCSVVMIRGVLAPGRQEDAVVELSDHTPAEALAQLRWLADVESDPRRGRALRSAIALLEDNARLQRDLAEHIEEVRASRARLIGAGTEERQRLGRILRDGALRYLDELEECLRSTSSHSHGDLQVAACLEEISHTRDDLEQLARGLHPRVLTDQGLAAALEELGRRSPVPVDVIAPARRFPERIETTVWYACAEALANVWKHAQATRAVVSITETQDALRATVNDDGVGGAGLVAGGGLSGLVDRLSVVDGELELVSSAAGTGVIITVPLP